MKLTCGLTFEQITKPCTYPNILELVVQVRLRSGTRQPPLGAPVVSWSRGHTLYRQDLGLTDPQRALIPMSADCEGLHHNICDKSHMLLTT